MNKMKIVSGEEENIIIKALMGHQRGKRGINGALKGHKTPKRRQKREE